MRRSLIILSCVAFTLSFCEDKKSSPKSNGEQKPIISPTPATLPGSAQGPGAQSFDTQGGNSANAGLPPAQVVEGRKLIPAQDQPIVAQDPRILQIDQMLTQTYNGKPGAAVLINKNGQTILRKGYGMADVAGRVPMSTATTFDLASTSKQFTALALLKLSEQGLLNLEQPIQNYFPQIPIVGGRAVRVIDLIGHKSGLFDYTDVYATIDPATALRLTKNDIFAMIAGKPQKPAGQEYEYCNTNYVLMALIVEKVTGKPFSEYVATYFFEPLGMTGSVALDQPGVVLPNRAKAYSSGALVNYDDSLINGDGNIFSNLLDMERWELGFQTNKIFSAASLTKAFTPLLLDGGVSTEYGFGFFIPAANNGNYVFHTGGWTGTRTYLGRWSSQRLSIVLLTNEDSNDPQAIAEGIAAQVP